MGGKNTSGEPRSSQVQARLAEQLFSQSGPIRDALFDRAAAFLGVSPTPISSAQSPPQLSPFSLPGNALVPGMTPRNNRGFIERAAQAQLPGAQPSLPAPESGSPTLDPTQSILFSPGKQAIEDQFRNAKQSIISSGATGGALADRLAELELQKAKQIGNFQGNLAQDELNRTFSLATGIIPQVNSALTSSAASQAQTQAARSNKLGNLGRAAGFVAGSALTKNPAGGAATSKAMG